MKKRIRSFDPVASKNAKVVILGSMPGERSLAAAEYYAHPRNAFWKIMQELIGVAADAPYKERLQSLIDHDIALWDVLHSCHRQGSLDTAIQKGSVQINDFTAFFHRHDQIGVVLFNGATSERYYKRYVWPEIKNRTFIYIRMPSSSPAHAGMSLQHKVKAWRSGLNATLKALGKSEK